MRVRTGEELLDRLRERLRESETADVAVAWAAACPAVDELRRFCERGGSLRVVVGLAGNATDPATLRELCDFAELRIGTPRTSAGGIFHPKYYRFCRQDGATVWIGSANLTRGGFGRNEELMLEAAASATPRDWFESLWGSLAPDPREAIAAYESTWRPPPARPGQRGAYRTQAGTRPGTARARLDASWSWEDFVAGLRNRHEEMLASGGQNAEGRPEEPWSVFGEYQSWLDTISVGNSVTRLSNWRRLNRLQTDVLLGRDRYGALGTLRGAGTATGVFLGAAESDADAREAMRRLVAGTMAPDGDPVRAGVQALNGLRSRPRIGVGVATRFASVGAAGLLRVGQRQVARRPGRVRFGLRGRRWNIATPSCWNGCTEPGGTWRRSPRDPLERDDLGLPGGADRRVRVRRLSGDRGRARSRRPW